MKSNFLSLMVLFLSLPVFGQDFDDLNSSLSKKERSVFDIAVKYEADFYNRIFLNKEIDFSQISVRVVSNEITFFHSQIHGGLAHRNPAGFYDPENKELVVYKDKENVNSFLETCFHELSHAFLHLHAEEKAVPAWLNEGLSDYLENMTYSSKKITHKIDKYSLARVKTLIELNDLNLSEFADWDYSKFATASFSQEGYGYAIGYCMVLLLMQKGENEAIILIRNLIGCNSSIEVFDNCYEGGFIQFEKDFMTKYGK